MRRGRGEKRREEEVRRRRGEKEDLSDWTGVSNNPTNWISFRTSMKQIYWAGVSINTICCFFKERVL
jgi:hypothetical protein